MTHQAPIRAATPGVLVANDAAALGGFCKPDVAAAIWQRAMPQPVLSWLATLAPERLPRSRIIVHKSRIAETLSHLCEMAQTPRGHARTWLEDDVTRLSQSFANLMSVEYLRLRLDVVTGNACRKFHVDGIAARLVCTYRGTGTQYGTSHDGEDPAIIHTVGTGDPILLRGTRWPEEPEAGLRHRSPPIEGSGETRLLLVLDPISDPQEDA